jgi:serine phosphatase RsbU (regulator of sigma subunit)
MARIEIAFAGVSRPYPGETVSGDAWLVSDSAGGCRIAVIDALGHGPGAHEVARIAVGALEEHPDLDAAAALAACHRALTGTRGAAIAIASIDSERARLSYAGIGNIEAQVWQDETVERPISYRGIAGVTARTPRQFEISLGSDWILAMHSDGVSARFNLSALVLEHGRDQQAIAEAILTRHARMYDDATVVVARPLL